MKKFEKILVMFYGVKLESETGVYQTYEVYYVCVFGGAKFFDAVY